MKKLLLLLLCVPLIGFGQEKISIEELNFLVDDVNGLSYAYFHGELFSCVNCEFWNKKNEKIETSTFLNGKREGFCVKYRSYGYNKCFYKNGWRHGKYIEFNEKLGRIVLEREYVEDIIINKKGIHENGSVCYFIVFKGRDAKNGNENEVISSECWDESGKEIECSLIF